MLPSNSMMSGRSTTERFEMNEGLAIVRTMVGPLLHVAVVAQKGAII